MKCVALVVAIACASPTRPPAVVTLEPFLPASPVCLLPFLPASPVCLLPPVPEFPPLVGFPDSKTIYVTIDDMRETVAALERVTAWLKAANRCLNGQPVTPAPNR